MTAQAVIHAEVRQSFGIASWTAAFAAVTLVVE